MLASGFATRIKKATTDAPASFLLSFALPHLRIMVGRAGAEKSAPVPSSGIANPVRLTTLRFATDGGDNPVKEGISHAYSSLRSNSTRRHS
ncbi:hypothetical protein HAX39_05480 [Citrobacter freundii]|nr:hypothetical protein [Citrobacter freundii]